MKDDMRFIDWIQMKYPPIRNQEESLLTLSVHKTESFKIWTRAVYIRI